MGGAARCGCLGPLSQRTGQALTVCGSRRDTAGFIHLLDAVAQTWPRGELILILDNLSTHKTMDVRLWALAHDRVRFLFQPTYAPWLNLIEPWWKTLRSLALKGRRFVASDEIIQAIAAATSYWNARCHPIAGARLLVSSYLLDGALKQIQTPEVDIASRPITNIRQLTSKQEQEVRKSIRETLETIDPYDFEELVKYLLQNMGYENVEVTKKANDGGVDVIADIEVGITSIREVVQVKRFKSTVSRPILDQLRGSLHRFDAVQGTIITTGKFTKDAQGAAFERGAPPITLIDGDRLIQLMIDTGIGVTHEEVKVLRFNPSDFEFGTEAETEVPEA